MDLFEYFDEVFRILESFDYQYMILGYAAEDVAESLTGVMKVCYIMTISPMKCAIIIWSLTWNYQILPSTEMMQKH